MGLHLGASPLAGVRTIFNPFDPRSWVDAMLESASKDLQEVLLLLQRMRWPDWNSDWFEYLFGNAITIAVVLSACLAVIVSVSMIVTRRGFRRSFNVFGTAFVVASAGILFPLLMGIVTWISDSLTTIPIAIGEWAAGDDWLSYVRPPTVTDLVDAVWSATIIKTFSVMMWLEVNFIHYALYFLAVMGIWFFVLRNTEDTGYKLWRGTVSAVITCLFAKPLMMLVIALGSVVLKFIPGDSATATLWTLVLVMLFANLAFFGLWWAAKQQYVKYIGNGPKSRVEGRVDIKKLPTPDSVQRQVMESSTQSLVKIDPDQSSPSATPRSVSVSLSDIARDAAGKKANQLANTAITAAATSAGAPALGVGVVAAKEEALRRRRERRINEKSEGSE